MESPPFEIAAHDDHCVLLLNTGLNQLPWSDVERVGSDVIQSLDPHRKPRLLVDLTTLDYMGSAQVAMLVRVWKSIKPRNGAMAVQVKSPTVRQVLTIAGLHKLWLLTDDRTTACQSLGIRAPVGSNGVLPHSSSDDAGPTDQPVSAGRQVAVLMCGAFANLVAAAVLGVHVFYADRLDIDPSVILWSQVMFAAIGLFCGLWCVIRTPRGYRALGAACIFAGTLLASIELLHYQDWFRKPAEPAETTTAGSSPSAPTTVNDDEQPPVVSATSDASKSTPVANPGTPETPTRFRGPAASGQGAAAPTTDEKVDKAGGDPAKTGGASGLLKPPDAPDKAPPAGNSPAAGAATAPPGNAAGAATPNPAPAAGSAGAQALDAE